MGSIVRYKRSISTVSASLYITQPIKKTNDLFQFLINALLSQFLWLPTPTNLFLNKQVTSTLRKKQPDSNYC